MSRPAHPESKKIARDQSGLSLFAPNGAKRGGPLVAHLFMLCGCPHGHVGLSPPLAERKTTGRIPT